MFFWWIFLELELILCFCSNFLMSHHLKQYCSKFVIKTRLHCLQRIQVNLFYLFYENKRKCHYFTCFSSHFCFDIFNLYQLSLESKKYLSSEILNESYLLELLSSWLIGSCSSSWLDYHPTTTLSTITSVISSTWFSVCLITLCCQELTWAT